MRVPHWIKAGRDAPPQVKARWGYPPPPPVWTDRHACTGDKSKSLRRSCVLCLEMDCVPSQNIEQMEQTCHA